MIFFEIIFLKKRIILKIKKIPKKKKKIYYLKYFLDLPMINK